jgi:hypothetical protein
MLFSLLLLLLFSLLPFYLCSFPDKNQDWNEIIFLSALCKKYFILKFFLHIRPVTIIALKKNLVNDFLQKCVDN